MPAPNVLCSCYQIGISEERTKEIMSLLDKSGDGSLQVDEQIVLVDDKFMVDIDPRVS